MKENDPLIVMTHAMIENSAPRPQLYQQVRPVRLCSTSSLLAVCCAMLLLRRLRPHSTFSLLCVQQAAPHPLLLTVIVQNHANTGTTCQTKGSMKCTLFGLCKWKSSCMFRELCRTLWVCLKSETASALTCTVYAHSLSYRLHLFCLAS